MEQNKNILARISLALVVGLFVLSSISAQHFAEQIKPFVDQGGYLGMFLYVAITIIAIVIAPFSTIPLIPFASAAWGWMITGALSIIGWGIGAIIAFLLAQHYGKPLVQRFIPPDRLRAIERLIPQKNLFWSVIFLRMTVPVDVLSYALGLFTEMSLESYVTATIIGITPFALFIAYSGTLVPMYQLIAMGVLLLVIIIGHSLRSKR